MKKAIIIIILSLIIAGGIATWKFYSRSKKQTVGPAVCTQEAKQCPDGSYVGRTGPNCEFAKCPIVNMNIDANQSSQKFPDATQWVSFQYSDNLTTKYIRAQTWPPKVTSSDNAFSCNPTPDQKGLPEVVALITINGRSYCKHTFGEGTAGSIYARYIYLTEKNSKLVSVDFTLQYPDCSNYEDPKKTECFKEGTALNSDYSDLEVLVDQFAQSVKMN